MGKFCTKCGKELVEGKTHKCEAEESKKEVTKKETTNQSNIDFKGAFADCVAAIKSIFTKPVETISNFVSDNKFISGIMFIVMAALARGLQVALQLQHTYSKIKSDYYKPEEPKYFDEFFEAFATDLAKYAAIAFIAYLVVTKVLKGTSTWKQTLSATGLSLIVVIGATLINTILFYFDGDLVVYLMGYVSVFSTTLFTILLYEGIKSVANVDKNKLFLALGSILVGAEIVVDLVQKIFD